MRPLSPTDSLMQMINEEFTREEKLPSFCSVEVQNKVQEGILMQNARRENRKKFGAKKVRIEKEGEAKKGDCDEVEDPDSDDTTKERESYL